jgi:hypothetical protein
MKNAYKEHRKAEQAGRSEIDEQLMKWAKDEEIVLPDDVKTPEQFAERIMRHG